MWEGEGPVTDLFGPVITEGSESARAHAQARCMLSSGLSLGARGHSNNSGEIQAACEGFIELLHREPAPVVWIYDSELAADVARGKHFISGESELCDSLRKLFALLSQRQIARLEHAYSHPEHAYSHS